VPDDEEHRVEDDPERRSDLAGAGAGSGEPFEPRR